MIIKYAHFIILKKPSIKERNIERLKKGKHSTSNAYRLLIEDRKTKNATSFTDIKLKDSHI
jgi:hypothetical protein